MKRRHPSALCVLALAACNKKPEEVTTQAPTTVQATTVATDDGCQGRARDVFEMLQLAQCGGQDAAGDITEGLAAAKKAVRDEMFAIQVIK